jgi:[FeFe] hydrogenase H-cluster maturation GTPase HydF
MDKTPKGNRLHLALFGRTNVGKSSLLNYIVGQEIAITSPLAGTTTDVVEKAMELLPLGPVLFLDTAGLDDTSLLSSLRLEKTEKIFPRADVILLVLEPDIFTDYEEMVLAKAKENKTPVIAIVTKVDLALPSLAFLERLQNLTRHVLSMSIHDQAGRDRAVETLKTHLLAVAPDDFVQPPPLVKDLLPTGKLALLVVPIDIQAPKGRLILPQVQAIRDLLDNDGAALMVKEKQLKEQLDNLKEPPGLVVSDSQAILTVAEDVPLNVPLTTFSILFARQKGDLTTMAMGAAALDKLVAGDKILIAEACAHHALEDDIGRIKIPRWIEEYKKVKVEVRVAQGRDYPDNLKDIKVVIHCGACMLTRREMLNRISQARAAGVAITNYGVVISHLQQVAGRTLAPFPEALRAWERAVSAGKNPGGVNGKS